MIEAIDPIEAIAPETDVYRLVSPSSRNTAAMITEQLGYDVRQRIGAVLQTLRRLGSRGSIRMWVDRKDDVARWEAC